MNIEREKEHLAEAQEMVEKNVDFKVFHNSFFAKGSPLLKGLNKSQRATLIKSPLYLQLKKLAAQLGIDQGYLSTNKETGESVEREFSGEFRVRIAKSTHQNLVVEAKKEHVSLNHLCSLKLSRPLEAA